MSKISFHFFLFALVFTTSPNFLAGAEAAKTGDGPRNGATTVFKYFPIVAVGGGSDSILTVHNFGITDQIISVSFFSETGDSLFAGGSIVHPGGVTVRNLAETLAGSLDLSEPRRIWMRVSATGDFAAGGLQTLEVGEQSLLPYGVLESPVCRRMIAVVNETGDLRGAIALLNVNDPEVTCQLSSHGVIEGNNAFGAVTLQGFNVSAVFLAQALDYGVGFQGAVDIECSGDVAGYSLLQDSMTGNTSAVSVQCVAPTPVP